MQISGLYNEEVVWSLPLALGEGFKSKTLELQKAVIVSIELA